MNDFTKDELEEIAEMMRHARKQGIETTHNLSYQVEEKAWRMIENYCEHESDGYSYYKSGDRCTDFLTYASHDSPCFLKCRKCKELYR